MNKNRAHINDLKLVLEVLSIQRKMTNIGWNQAYQEYRNSEHWADLKRRMRQQRSECCEICGSTETVDLYHLQHKNLFCAGLSDLIWLCDIHHAEFIKNIANGQILEDAESHFLLRDTLQHLFEFEKNKISVQLEQSTQTNQKLEDDLSHANQIIDDLNLAIADLNSDSERSRALKEDLELEKSAKKQLILDVEQLNLKVTALDDEVLKAQEHSNDLQTQLGQQQKDNEVLRERLQQSRHEQESLLEQVKKSSTEKKNLIARVRRSDGEQKILVEQVQQFNDERDLLCEKFTDLQVKANEYRAFNGQLQATIDEQKGQVIDLATAVSQQELLLAEVKNSARKVSRQNKVIRAQLNIRISRWAGSLLLVVGLVAGFVSGQTYEDITSPSFSEGVGREAES